MTCWHCRSRLDATGRCPGEAPLLERDGHRYGTAAQIAHSRGGDITADRVRDWARRSRKPGKLHGMLPGRHLPGRGRGTTWYDDDQAAIVERATRVDGRGPGRGERVELTAAA